LPLRPCHLEGNGAVLVVTLDRPERRNAVDGPTARDLSAAFRGFDADPRLSVAVLTGAGGIVGANADLWTANAGFNQDIGIFVSVDGGADQLISWKESGGFAGTFSPNAAFAEVTYSLNATSTHVFKLKWKTNKNTPGATIFVGAGPIGTNFSPTTLTVQLVS
jgi:hypothetical protein